jgi:hypothetical protein
MKGKQGRIAMKSNVSTERRQTGTRKIIPLQPKNKRQRSTNTPQTTKKQLRDIPHQASSQTPLSVVTHEQQPKSREAQLVEELNTKHAVVQVGSKVVVLTENDNPEKGFKEYSYLPFADFKKLYSNQVAEGQKRDVGSWWLTHPERRQYEGVIFTPGLETPGYFNLWRGFAVAPQKGECSLFLAHIRDNICKGDEALFRWVLAWLANAVQRPHERPGTALIVRGKQGTGKGVFARNFGSLFGQHFRHISQQRHLTGHFNAHLRDCLLLFVDEGYWAGDRSSEGVLKALITEPEIMVEAKGIDAVPARNYVRVIAASNNDWVVPAGMEERRFCVLDVADTHMQDQTYFKAIEEEMANGGREALLHYLLLLDLRTYPNPAVIPHTEALLEQKLLSMTPEQKWWYGRLRNGSQTSDRQTWEPWVETQMLYGDFTKEAKESGQAWRGSPEEFGKKLVKLCPSLERTRKSSASCRFVNNSQRPWGYSFPSLEECQKAFEHAVGMKLRWAEEND